MSEEDFVLAWILATRVGHDDHWTIHKGMHLIENAKQVYKQITQESKDDTRGD